METTTEDYREIRAAVRQVCADFDDAYWRQHDEAGEFPWEFYDAIAAAGWIGIAIAQEYGGGGGGMTEASVLMEEIAASGAGLNGCSAVHLSVFGTHPISAYGSEDMKLRYLPQVASGQLHVALGITEPEAGSDTARITTRAVQDGDRYIVRGRKVWTTKAPFCAKVVLLVRTSDPGPGQRGTDGLTLLFADLNDSDKVQIRPIPKLGRNAVVSCEVVYDGLAVDVSDRVGEEGKGFRYLLDALNAERILLASEALGLGKVALRRAVDYAKHRQVFGRPIGMNQAISFPLAEAYARLRAAELAVRVASDRYDKGLPTAEHSNIAKWLCAEAGFFSADRAMQTHGGFGYAKEYDVERYWREVRLLGLAPISQEMVLNYVSTRVLGLPRSY